MLRKHPIPAREGFEIGMRKGKDIYMPELHQELERSKAFLRNELRDALRLRDAAADLKLAETEAKAERGRALLKQAEAELAALQVSQHEFRERCISDYSFAILASIESGGDIPPMETDSSVLDDRPLVAAQMRLMLSRPLPPSLTPILLPHTRKRAAPKRLSQTLTPPASNWKSSTTTSCARGGKPVPCPESLKRVDTGQERRLNP